MRKTKGVDSDKKKKKKGPTSTEHVKKTKSMEEVIGIIPIQFSESEGDEGEVNEVICLGNQLEQSVMDELESGTSNSKLISSSKQIDEQNEIVEFVEEIRAVQSERKQGNKL